MMKWYELASRWRDRCVTCGESNQRLISFSQCISCRTKENEAKKNKESKK